ncbi:MAG: tyrosine-type recombinase/integrase [Nanoarchaeota archaeon]
MERYKSNTLSKTQATKRRRRKYPNVFFKKELSAIFNEIEEPKIMVGSCLTFFCALRISEVCNLKWRDIDLENKRLKVVDGKNHKDGFVPISSLFIPILEKWKQLNPHEEYFLPAYDETKPHLEPTTLLKAFKKAIEKAGLCIVVEKNSAGLNQHQYKFHTLRHSRCTHLLSNGVPVQKVQHFMRHDKVDTTLTYTWILDAELNSMVEEVDRRAAKSGETFSEQKQMGREDAVEILKKRLAHGEISPKEYRKLFEVLAGQM